MAESTCTYRTSRTGRCREMEGKRWKFKVNCRTTVYTAVLDFIQADVLLTACLVNTCWRWSVTERNTHTHARTHARTHTHKPVVYVTTQNYIYSYYYYHRDELKQQGLRGNILSQHLPCEHAGNFGSNYFLVQFN